MNNKIKIPWSFLSIYPSTYLYTNKKILNTNPQESVDSRKIANYFIKF